MSIEWNHERVRTAEFTPPVVTDSPAFLWQLLNAVQHSLIAVDRDERITFWNDQATRFYGYSRVEALGQKIGDVTARASDSNGVSEILKSVWNGVTWTGEFPVSHRDGTSVQARVRLFPVFDASHQVTGIVGLSEDISEEVAARSAMERTRERFERLARTTSDAVWDWEVDTDTLWGNPAYEALVGPRQQGQSARDAWLARIHPEDHPGMLATVRAAENQASTFRHEYRFLNRATNRYVRIMDRGFFVRDGAGNLLRVVGAMADVSEVAEIERAFQASEERFRLVFDSSPLGMVIVDRSFQILQANYAYGRMLGYTPAEIIGRSIVELTHPDDQAACGQLTEELFLSEQPFFRIEKRYVHRDGTVLWAAVTATVLPNRDGSPPLGLALIEDITEQRRVRDELTEAKARAEAAVNAKLRFLAQISHEIRSPMNGVLGMLELLDGGALIPEQRENVSIAREAAGSLLGMLEEILDLTRLDEQRLPLRPMSYSPTQLVRDVAALYRERAISKGIELGADVASDLPDAHVADPARLRQILVNLLDNAIKFTLHGRVTIRAFVSGPALCFSVNDTGIGIPADSLDSVFETFSDISAQTSASVGGTGLGLAISRRLARLMGGDVTVSSCLGEGSCFTLSLPIETSGFFGPPAPVRQVAVTSFAGRRVLVVEDNLINQRVAAGLLHRLQCEVDVAANGVEGLQKALAVSYDVIFMDAMMPVMDGFEATVELRRREPTGRHVPVIGLTALATDQDRARCLASGMDDFLAKPADFQGLSNILSRWLVNS